MACTSETPPLTPGLLATSGVAAKSLMAGLASTVDAEANTHMIFSDPQIRPMGIHLRGANPSSPPTTRDANDHLWPLLADGSFRPPTHPHQPPSPPLCARIIEEVVGAIPLTRHRRFSNPP